MSKSRFDYEESGGEQVEDPHALRARGLLVEPAPIFWYCPDCGQATFDSRACNCPFCCQVVTWQPSDSSTPLYL